MVTRNEFTRVTTVAKPFDIDHLLGTIEQSLATTRKTFV
jgi:hypothetical protein